jgi:predicted dehydrogenase
MENQKAFQSSRRDFLRNSIIGAAGVMLLPSYVQKKYSKEINLAFIGLGRQGMYLLDSFLQLEGVKIVAGCDVYKIKRTRFENNVNTYYKNKGIDSNVKVVEDYHAIVNDPEIDAIVIASPDHWHALIAIDACKEKKHIYLEKPLTFTIFEGQELIKAVRKNKVILSVGSMQRSDPLFQHAVKMVHDARIGDIEKVSVWVGQNPFPKTYDLSAEAIPDGLNWDLWSGPAHVFPFNNQLNPPISIDPPVNEKIWGAWRWYKELGGGLMTDWGAHMIDIAQWGLKRDKSGPVEIIPAGFYGNENFTYLYEDGIKMVLEPVKGSMQGVKFWGKLGWIEIARDYFDSSNEELKPAFAVGGGMRHWQKHHRDFVDAINSNREPIVPVEIGHSSCTACTLGNIAHELNKPIKWNPLSQTFIENEDTSKLLHYDYRDGYKID